MLHILFFVSLFSSQGSGGLAPPVEERQVVLQPPAKEINPCCGWLERCLTPLQAMPAVVGSNGLEPSTSRLSGVRSNHLSYEPISVAGSFPIGQTFLPGNVPTAVRDFQPHLAMSLKRDLAAATCRWWRRTESNCRPPACKAGALPAELRPRIRFVPLGKSTLLSSQRALKIKQRKTY